MRRVCGMFALGMMLVGCGVIYAQPFVYVDDALEDKLRTIASAHHGKVALYAAAVRPDYSFAGLNQDVEVQTASVIKLAILYHAMVEIREGRAKWDEAIHISKDDLVGGSGILHFFDAPKTITLKDALTMMIIVSDNSATNLMIDRFGVDAINARSRSLGLEHTVLYKKVFKPATGPLPADQPKFGLGKTTPREMTALMFRIGVCGLRLKPHDPRVSHDTPFDDVALPDSADKAVCAVGLDMLKSQFYRETIPRYLPGGGEGSVASKTGSLDAVRADVAIVSTKRGPVVMSIFTYDNADHSWTVDNEGELTIARLAKAIVDAWSPEGLDPSHLVPGLGITETDRDAAARK